MSTNHKNSNYYNKKNNRIIITSCCLPLVQIDLSLLANNVGKSATNTLNGGQGIHNLLSAIDVRVQNTENVLELLLVVVNNQRR